jgi:hypothetical protein
VHLAEHLAVVEDQSQTYEAREDALFAALHAPSLLIETYCGALEYIIVTAPSQDSGPDRSSPTLQLAFPEMSP